MAKKRRPEGWTKEAALEWAKAHPGSTLPDVARAFATADCSWQPLVYDLYCFRGEDPAWREEFDRIVPASTRGAGHDLELHEGMEDWKVRWALAYLEEEDKIAASARVGLSWTTVQTYLRSRHRNFDPHFKDLHDQVESFFIASDESDIRYAMRVARETADARTLGWLAFERLGRRDRERWGKNETVVHQGTVEHRHVVELQQAHKQVADRFSKLFAPRPAAALPVPPLTITLPPESVKVSESGSGG